ncbi:hypothetical protein [Endozoicomonas ascidiicola]|uniref:hypothetical protein n=1 Tax=Endozoicomonas ascidiicola TaxID=1698521 RepID=UPI00082A4697|nr:hypothetical protein [Endozoicomonas ascidiicola]
MPEGIPERRLSSGFTKETAINDDDHQKAPQKKLFDPDKNDHLQKPIEQYVITNFSSVSSLMKRLTRISGYSIQKFDHHCEKTLQRVFESAFGDDVLLPSVESLQKEVADSFESDELAQSARNKDKKRDHGFALDGCFSSDVVQTVVYYLYILLYLHARGKEVNRYFDRSSLPLFLASNWHWVSNPNSNNRRAFFYQSDAFQTCFGKLVEKKKSMSSTLVELELNIDFYHRSIKGGGSEKSADFLMLGLLWGIDLMASNGSSERMNEHLKSYLPESVIKRFDDVYSKVDRKRIQ